MAGSGGVAAMVAFLRAATSNKCGLELKQRTPNRVGLVTSHAEYNEYFHPGIVPAHVTPSCVPLSC
jgi:hypothetical protein